jgi:hypothetical protein
MKVIRWIWAMVPVLSFGMLSWLAFGFLAARRRSALLAAAAVGYFVLLVLVASPVGEAGDSLSDLGGMIMLLLWGTSSFHACWIANGKGGNRRAGTAQPLSGAMPPAIPPAWSPAPPPPGQPGTPDALLVEIANSAARFNAAPADRRIDTAVWAGLHKSVVDSWTLLTTARQKSISGDQLIAVELMYSDYVPSSVRAVTALAPEQLVTAEDASRANRSAREIVDAISGELTAMMRSVSSGDLSKLDEQRAFLQSRFGHSGSIRL